MTTPPRNHVSCHARALLPPRGVVEGFKTHPHVGGQEEEGWVASPIIIAKAIGIVTTTAIISIIAIWLS